MTNSATLHQAKVPPFEGKMVPGPGMFDRAWRYLIRVILLLFAALAIYVTIYAWPKFFDSSAKDRSLNLGTEALFFWIEVFVIVLGLEQYKLWRAKRNTAHDLVTAREALANAQESIEDVRYRFAVELDNAKKEGGYYDTDTGSLNAEVAKIRNEFLHRRYKDDNVTLRTESIWDRILRSIDAIVESTYDSWLESERLNKELKAMVTNGDPDDSETAKQLASKLEAVLGNYLDIANTSLYSGFGALSKVIDRILGRLDKEAPAEDA